MLIWRQWRGEEGSEEIWVGGGMTGKSVTKWVCNDLRRDTQLLSSLFALPFLCDKHMDDGVETDLE